MTPVNFYVISVNCSPSSDAHSSIGQESVQSVANCRVLLATPSETTCGRLPHYVLRSLGCESRMRPDFKSNGLLSRRYGFESRRACSSSLQLAVFHGRDSRC